MIYTLNEIKHDIAILDMKQFFIKYMLRSNNWYFETVLGISSSDIIRITDDFKTIISNLLGISFNNIVIVGSGKIGYSLSPKQEKIFKEFNIDGNERDASDIDIAIISSKLFHYYWDLFRKSYRFKYRALYGSISMAIYRGYIGEYHLQQIDGCRRKWNLMADKSKKALQNELYFQHKISYRLYRSWEDIEEYQINKTD